MKRALSRPTRSDVAKEAGVTDTIVSYVINANRYVDREKKQRVHDAIKKLGYRPNTMARALKGKTTNHILFVVDDIQSEHFANIINEIDTLASNKGYFFTLCFDKGDDDFFQRITDGFFDGLVIGSSRFPENKIQELIDLQIPVVLFEIRDYPGLKGSFGKINTGLFDGACQCVQAMFNNGSKNIAYVGGRTYIESYDEIVLEDFRFQGYKSELNRLGLEYNRENTIVSYKTKTDLKERVIALLQSENQPDAFLCKTDYVACVVMEAIKEYGLSLPRDVSVVGFNDSAMCSFTEPKLSSVKIDRKSAGKKVLELLEGLIHKNENQSYEVLLQSKLIIRDSI